jgi:acetolactate synthase-1/2/3 large subunit
VMKNVAVDDSRCGVAEGIALSMPLFRRKVSVAEGTVIALEDAGIDLVLGICANRLTPIFDALIGHKTIRTIQVRQELVGSLAANAYGRLTGRPAVLMGGGGFILGTGTQGIIESLLGSTPMLILVEICDGGSMSHHCYYQSGSGEYAAYDAVGALRAICKRVFVAQHPAQAVQMVQLAVKHATTGDPGPVAVVFDSSCLEGAVGPQSFPRLYSSSGYLKSAPRGIDGSAVSRALSLLSSSQRPVIVAGHGVRLSEAYHELQTFASAIDAPVVTTQGGKGVMDEHSPYAGGVFGSFGADSANALVREADLLIAVGTRLGALDTVEQNPALIDPQRQAILQIDIEPLNAAWTLPTDTVVIGDAAAALARTCTDYAAIRAERAEGATARVARAVREHDLPLSSAHTSNAAPLRPERLISILQEVFPANGIVLTDAGENRIFMLRWFKTHGGGAYLMPHGGGGMGYAVGAAFGAKLAHPERPVMAVCGDGGFPMTMNALMNGFQEKVPFIVVIFNNGSLGWAMHVTPKEKQHHYEFVDFDHAAIARAMGCRGVRVESPDALRSALLEALSSNVPSVIDVLIAREASYLDVLAKIATSPREPSER